MNTITKIIIVALIVGGLSFYGGIKYNQSKTPTLTRGANAAAAGFAGARGARGTAGMAGDFIQGEILSKDASGITVKLANGGSKIIFLSASTTVMKATPGSASDLVVGEQVTTTGSANADGSVTAQSIQIRSKM